MSQATNHDRIRLHPAVWVLSFAVVAFTLASAAQAGPTWPQWGGVNRDFKAEAEGLAETWPEGGPPKLWSRDLGEGYSSIVCDDDRLYTMYRVDDEEKGLHQEVIVALDRSTGDTAWEYKYDAVVEKDMSSEFGAGPHSTPLLIGDRLFAVGVLVRFQCLDKKTGKVLWSRDLRKDFKASHLMYGYGASPFAYKDTVILPVGGEGHAIVAFNQKDGSTAWKSQDFGPTYASPFVAKVGGEQQLIVFADKVAAGLDPSNGKLKWTHQHPTQWGANISTPVWGDDGYLFISSAYGMGSRGIRLAKKDGKTVPEELWHNRKMKIHFGNAIRIGKYVYGSSGDMSSFFFAAVNIKTGKFAWRKRGINKASCVYGDGKLILLDEQGNLLLTRVARKKMTVLAQAKVCDRNAWTVPTLVGKTLYVRDRHKIMALNLGE